MSDESCDCGCSTKPATTEATDPCACGCECCAQKESKEGAVV